MISKDTPLIFTHIPKTGGMSMFANMARHYGTNIADLYNISAYSNAPAPAKALLQNKELCVYAGHFPFGLHEWLGRSAYYMAIVRKPLERILSLYHYSIPYRALLRELCKDTGKSRDALFKSGEAADFYEDFIPWFDTELTLPKFLDCHSPELENGMVRRFSGVGLQAEPCTRETLGQAKDNIEKYYSMIGMQERYSDAVALFRMTFKLNFREYHVNKSAAKKKKDSKLTLNIKKRIREMNALDVELYDWIAERFDRQLASPTPPISVPGSGRNDYENVKLWRAVGHSPVRQAVMEFKERSAQQR